MADNYPRTREGLEKIGFSRLTKSAVCRACDAPIEWWKTRNGKKIPMTVNVHGTAEELVMHLDLCPGRRQFLGAGSGADARPPRKFTNEEAVRNMRQRTNARVVVIITDDGHEAAWRDGIPGEDLRSDLIAAANFVRTAVNGKEAKRG